MKDKRLTSVPKLPSRSITRISDPISLRRLQVPCAQFEPLIHDNEGDAKSRERHVVQYQPWLLRSIMWLLKAVHVGGSLDLDLDRVHVWCNIVRQPLLTINSSRREPE